MLVTLDADAEGKLTLQRREFYVLDSALPASGLKPYMPGIYEFERFDTLSPAQAQALLKSLEHADGVSNHGSGHSWGPPGHPRNGTSTLRNALGQLILRENLKILAHEADAQGLYQVDVELISEHGPASVNQSLQPDDEP